MTDLSPESPFGRFFGEVPPDAIISHVLDGWELFVTEFQGATPAIHNREEPQLTKALQVVLQRIQDGGGQPFPGDFFAELQEFDLDAAGMPKCLGRTDIEWRLFGVPAFILEFKILDGKKSRRDKYLSGGIKRFLEGQYSKTSPTGAMLAFLRTAAAADPDRLLTAINGDLVSLNCPGVTEPSELAPAHALFDTAHDRAEPLVSPITLAHVFITLPVP